MDGYRKVGNLKAIADLVEIDNRFADGVFFDNLAAVSDGDQ